MGVCAGSNARLLLQAHMGKEPGSVPVGIHGLITRGCAQQKSRGREV